jgi:hypothetical protein
MLRSSIFTSKISKSLLSRGLSTSGVAPTKDWPKPLRTKQHGIGKYLYINNNYKFN